MTTFWQIYAIVFSGIGFATTALFCLLKAKKAYRDWMASRYPPTEDVSEGMLTEPGTVSHRLILSSGDLRCMLLSCILNAYRVAPQNIRDNQIQFVVIWGNDSQGQMQCRMELSYHPVETP